MKLYQSLLSPNCQKVVALAREVGVALDMVAVDVLKGGARVPELLARNPNGKVPILVDGEFVLWESNAMLGYLASTAGRSDLAPTGARERADVDRWLAWHNAHFGPAVGKVAFERVVKPLAGLGPADPAMVDKGIAEFGQFAAVLDAALTDRPYLCGELTIADFAIVTYAARCDSCGLDLRRHRAATAWLERMLERDSVRGTLAEARAAA